MAAPERGIRLTLLATSLLCLSVVNVVEPDLWGHVRYGQDLLASGRLPRSATHTFTVTDHPWINHELLSEVAFGWAANQGGAGGILVLKTTLGLLFLGLLVGAARRRGAGLAATAGVVLLATVNVAPGWSSRPQVFGFVLFLLELLILDAGTGGPRARPGLLWLLPPLFAVWTNTHASFLAGLGVLAVYLGVRAFEAVRGGRSAAALGHGAVLAAAALATLVNPYGPELLVWLAHDLTPPRPEITEWKALSPSDPRFVPFVLLAALVAVSFARAPRDAARLAVLAVTAWQSVTHLRHVPFFAIAAALWLPPRLRGLLPSLARGAPATARPLRLRALWAYVVPAVFGLGVALAIAARGLKVDKRLYPVTALQFMADHGIGGRLVAHFDWAQYAIAAFAPATTVAFDGRFRTCYPQEIADMHFDFLLGDAPGRRWRSPASPPIDGTRLLEFGAPDLVLVSRRYPRATGVMQSQAGWTLLYQDAVAQLWGRRERYDDPRAPTYLPPAARSIGDTPQTGLVDWPALPRATRPGTRT